MYTGIVKCHIMSTQWNDKLMAGCHLIPLDLHRVIKLELKFTNTYKLSNNPN